MQTTSLRNFEKDKAIRLKLSFISLFFKLSEELDDFILKKSSTKLKYYFLLSFLELMKRELTFNLEDNINIEYIFLNSPKYSKYGRNQINGTYHNQHRKTGKLFTSDDDII